MAEEKTYDLSQTYGIRALPLPFPELVAKSKTYGINPIGDFKALKSIFDYNSEMGNDLVFPLYLGGSAAEGGFQLPGEPEVSIRGVKKLVITTVGHGEKKQEVIEEVNLSNWELQISGTCFTEWTDENINEAEQKLYPKEQLIEILRYFKKAGGVKISCELLDPFGITQVVVTDIDVPYQRGTPTEQPYTLRCISEEEFEFDYTAEQTVNQT